MIECNEEGFRASGSIEDILGDTCCVIDGVVRGLLSEGLNKEDAALYLASIFKTVVDGNDDADVADVIAVSILSNCMLWQEEAATEEEPEMVVSAEEDEPVKVEAPDDSLARLIERMLGS